MTCLFCSEQFGIQAEISRLKPATELNYKNSAESTRPSWYTAARLVVASVSNLVRHSGGECNVSDLILSTSGDTLADTQSVAVELR